MNELKKKIFGCLAGSQIGSSMGAPVEHWDHEDIIEHYGGKLTKLVPYEMWGKQYPAGTTEDGVERQKLMVLSIRDNKGPITVRDLAKTWLKYVKEESFGMLAGQQDEIHYRAVKAGIPPEDSGKYDAHVGRMGFNRACHPIGIVNAGFPELAAKNALDVARLYQPPSGRGIRWKDDARVTPTYSIGIDWSAAICAAIAEAFKPSSTIDSVIKEATSYIVEPAAEEILEVVEIADSCSSYEELVEKYYEKYHAQGLPFAKSHANEVTAKAFGIFKYYEGDVKKAMIGSVNMGRDTDCLASVAAGISGAFNGCDAIPEKWINQVDEATRVNEYTVTRMTLKEQVDALYQALKKNYEGLINSIDELNQMT